MSALISMYDALCISLASRWMREQAMGEVAVRNGGIESFIMNMGSVKDNITEAERIKHGPELKIALTCLQGSIPFLMMACVIHEPNHNRTLYVNVEYRIKIIRKALVDQGSSINLNPLKVMHQLVCTEVHIQLVAATISSVSPTTSDTLWGLLL